MSRLAKISVLTAALLGFAGAAQALPYRFAMDLGPEALGATGSGSAVITIDPVAHEIGIDVSFSGLSGQTNVAHIHCCTAVPGTGTVGVAVTPTTLPGFPVGVQSGSYSIVLDSLTSATYTTGFRNNFGGGTVAGAEAAFIAGALAGKAYLNIHTLPNFPGGEIRGFLDVPEPATLALFGFGLLGLAGIRRRKAA